MNGDYENLTFGLETDGAVKLAVIKVGDDFFFTLYSKCFQLHVHISVSCLRHVTDWVSDSLTS